MERSPKTALIAPTSAGLYCAAGDFFIDPWRPVPRAVITHAHSDHARIGNAEYVTTHDGVHVLQSRVGSSSRIQTLKYGETLSRHGVRVSLLPAGHVLGSAQVRVEHRGEVWVVSGDYKTEPDRTCRTFEPVRCQTFITESTFGLPIYRWRPQSEIFAEINRWWRSNRDEGRASVLFAYALGKAQRLLAGLDPSIGPIYCHGAVERLNAAYRATGIELPETQYAGQPLAGRDWAGAMVVATPSSLGTPWLRKFGDAALGYVSGWMQARGTRRRYSVDRGFVLSDHADWPGLLATIEATGAERVLVTHGQVTGLVRWLCEQGRDAAPLHTEFRGETDDLATEETVAADAGT